MALNELVIFFEKQGCLQVASGALKVTKFRSLQGFFDESTTLRCLTEFFFFLFQLLAPQLLFGRVCEAQSGVSFGSGDV